MLLRNLFEAKMPSADAAFAFGRFNPAHQGHIEVYKTVQAAGNKWFIGTNSSTQGSNDPLTFEQKSAWMQAIYPAVKGHIVAEQSVVTLASKLYEIIGDDKTIAYVTDEKDWAWAGKLLNDYNGKQGPHGYYKFRAIRHVESPRVSSATALRVAARSGDEAAFYAASGTDPKLTVNGQTYYDTVVAAVGANPEKVKRVVKKKEPAVTEVTGDKSFDSMMRTIKKGTAKQKTADRRAEKADSQQRARDAFGPNPAAGLGIRKPGVAEGELDEGAGNIIAAFAVAGGLLLGSNVAYQDRKLAQQWMQSYQQIKDSDPDKADTVKKLVNRYKHTSFKNAGTRNMTKQQIEKIIADFNSQSVQEQGVAEGSSTAMANTTKRLTDPKDGATAKLRAAGDKRREDQLKSRNIAKKNESLKHSLQELSNDMLGKYKKAAGADAGRADAAGDFKRGDKRFKGINRATVKQFDNDAKKPNETVSNNC